MTSAFTGVIRVPTGGNRTTTTAQAVAAGSSAIAASMSSSASDALDESQGQTTLLEELRFIRATLDAINVTLAKMAGEYENPALWLK